MKKMPLEDTPTVLGMKHPKPKGARDGRSRVDLKTTLRPGAKKLKGVRTSRGIPVPKRYLRKGVGGAGGGQGRTSYPFQEGREGRAQRGATHVQGQQKKTWKRRRREFLGVSQVFIQGKANARKWP